MSEKLEIVDHLGRKTGEVKDRNLVHKDGDWYRSVHVWKYDVERGLLFQKRQSSKKVHPSKLVSTISGHVSAGISLQETVVEEAKEELSIDLNMDNFYKIGVIRYSFEDINLEIKDKEFINVYFLNQDVEVSDRISNEEVEQMEWMPVETLEQLTKKESPKLVPCYEEYDLVISHIRHAKWIGY